VATSLEVGDWLGLSSTRVINLRGAGVLPGGKGDEYDLKACVRAYCAHIRPAAGRNAAGGSAGAAGLDQARIEVLNEQRDRLRMLNEQMRGDTVLAEDMDTVVGAYADATRAKVLALPTRAAPLVLGLTSLAEVRDKLTELAHEACGDLAASEIIASVQDRARRRAGRGAGGDADIPTDGTAAEADGKPMGGSVPAP
jgi:phage terminase Nu1 subunit (DNA packaging protein)